MRKVTVTLVKASSADLLAGFMGIDALVCSGETGKHGKRQFVLTSLLAPLNRREVISAIIKISQL